MIMEEIDPNTFKQFPSQVLPKNLAKSVLDESSLKKIYKHMLAQMQQWFADHHNDKPESHIVFDPKMVNLNRLVQEQDINEVLVLAEYIMVIVVQGQNNEKFLERFLDLPDDAQEDMQELIEGAINLSVADA